MNKFLKDYMSKSTNNKLNQVSTSLMKNLTSSQKNHKIALSFDVEDWFTVRNMREIISEDTWSQQELRVNVGMDFVLNQLHKKNIKATFFILGWIAEKCPDLVRRISADGHEIACHGYSHTPIDLLTPESFETDLKKALQIIESITGKKVKGFRAPSFSVMAKTSWALPIIKKLGLEYDSSIFVTQHPDYGVKDFPETLTHVSGLTEVPLKKSQFLGFKLPVCGGGYFRLLPYPIAKAALKNDIKSTTPIMYFHPWEFDPNQPQVKLGFFKKFRHYVGLKSNQRKFIQLLNDFEFITIEEMVSSTSETEFSTYRFQ